MAHGVLYADPTNKPLSPLTSQVALQPNSYYVFYYTGGTLPAVVYELGDLSVAYPTNVVTADANGTFAGIFLDPTRVYRVQWFDQYNRRLMDVDPYISSLTSFGTSQLTINPVTGQVSVTPNSPGGAGAALTITAARSSIALSTGGGGAAPGVAEMQILNSGTTGATTGTFSGNTKPAGVSGGVVTQWMPINVGGVLYYMPLWN